MERRRRHADAGRQLADDARQPDRHLGGLDARPEDGLAAEQLARLRHGNGDERAVARPERLRADADDERPTRGPESRRDVGRGRDAKGAGIGGAAGGVGALIWVLATRGKDIVLPTGTNLELQLTVPLDFERDEIMDTPQNSPEGPAIPRRDPGPSL